MRERLLRSLPSYPKAEQDDTFCVPSAPCFILMFSSSWKRMTFGSSLVAAEVPARYLLCQTPLLGYTVVPRPGPPGPGRKGGGSKPPHSPPCALFAFLSLFSLVLCPTCLLLPPRQTNNTHKSVAFFYAGSFLLLLLFLSSLSSSIEPSPPFSFLWPALVSPLPSVSCTSKLPGYLPYKNN